MLVDLVSDRAHKGIWDAWAPVRAVAPVSVAMAHFVLWCWMNGKPGKSGSISTDGSTLYSYTLPTGKTEGGKKLVYDYTARGEFGFVSHTTSCHVSLAHNYLLMEQFLEEDSRCQKYY